MQTTENPDEIRDRVGLKVEMVKTGVNYSKSGGLSVKFEIDPTDAPHDLITSPLGTRYMTVLVEFSDHGEMVVPPSVVEGERAVKRAVMLCKDEQFQSFLGADSEETAAEKLKEKLKIASRADLKDDERAKNALELIRGDFLAWRQNGMSL